jgi:CHAT domain-containing protein
VVLDAGQVLRGFADQGNADLTVIVLAADRRKLAEFDSFDHGAEPVCFIAAAAGTYRVESRGLLSLDSPRAATAEDEVFCRAVEASTAAKRLQSQGGTQALRDAAEQNAVALELWRRADDRSGEARTLDKIGSVRHALSEYAAAREAFAEALPISSALGDLHSEGEALTGLGMASFRLGDLQTAFDRLNQALAIWRKLHYSYGEANALNNLSVLSFQVADWQVAITYGLRTLDLVRALRDRRGEAYTLSNLGVAYDALGEPETALQNLHQALGLFRAVGDQAAAGRTLDAMGRITLAEGKARTALAYEQEALGLAKSAGDRRTEAEATQRMGQAWERLQDARALTAYEDALTLFRAAGNRQGEAAALDRIGLAKAAQGDVAAGLELLEEALKLRQQIGLRDFVAATLSEIARIERDRGNLAAAQARIQAAIAIVETLRGNVLEQNLRTSYFGTKADYYAFSIDVLMRLGFDRLAFEAAERSRARSLLDALASARQGQSGGPDAALRNRERELRRRLDFQADQLLRAAGSNGATEREAELRSGVDETLHQIEEVEVRVAAENPRYGALAQEPIGVEQVQNTLDGDTLLLEYALGAEHSYLWAVSKDSLRSFMLAGRGAIEPVADEMAKVADRRGGRSEYERLGRELSKLLLDPAAGLLGKKRLVIVGDGPLLALSFATLPAPGSGVPLVADHEVVALPSISILALLRQRKQAAPSKTALVVADPVFDGQDPRVLRDVPREGGDAGGLLLPRLPFTREEAQAVAASADPSEVRIALGFEAAKSLLTGIEASRYGIVHIATHSLLDARRPELSSLAFSLVDARGHPVDGLLRLHEIYNLNLPAELVVLSACRSGDGRQIRGEGLVGLTRGFLFAGTRRAVAALWNVDDEATAELFRQFYRLQFGPERLRPAAALRAAQLAVARQPRWRSPYYWGGFVFEGEWR